MEGVTMLKQINPVQVPCGADILEAMQSGWLLIKDDVGIWLYGNGCWRVVLAASVDALVLQGYIEQSMAIVHGTREGVEYILTPKFFAEFSETPLESDDDLHVNQFSLWLVTIAFVGGALTLLMVILRHLFKGD